MSDADFNYANKAKYLAAQESVRKETIRDKKGDVVANPLYKKSVKEAYLALGGAIVGEPATYIGVPEELKPEVTKRLTKKKTSKKKK